MSDIPKCPRCLSKWHTDCYPPAEQPPGPVFGIIAWGVVALLTLALLLSAIT